MNKYSLEYINFNIINKKIFVSPPQKFGNVLWNSTLKFLP